MWDEANRYLLAPKEDTRWWHADSIVTKLVIPVVALITTIVIALGKSDQPLWATVSLVVFVAVGTVVVLAPFAIRAFRAVAQRLIGRRVATQFAPKVKRLAQRLHQHLEAQASDTLLYEVRDFASVVDSNREVVLPNMYGQAEAIKAWVQQISFTGFKSSYLKFPQLVRGVDLAMHQYNDLCRTLEGRARVVVAQATLDSVSITKLRTGWNHGRGSQVKLLQDWSDTVNELNHALNTQVCGGYFQQIKALE
jgi:hypothetical protein